MDTFQLILLSHRDEDAELFGAIAQTHGFLFQRLDSKIKLQTQLLKVQKSAVVWAVDHPESAQPGSRLNLFGVREVLAKVLPPSRVFAISDQPLSRYPEFFKVPGYFHHHLLRRKREVVETLYAGLIAQAFTSYPEKLAQKLLPGARDHVLSLRRSADRFALIEQIRGLLEEAGIPERLAEMTTTAVDELLINAIFTAPVNNKGEHLRANWPRDHAFDLAPDEKVSVEFVRAENHLAISVTDGFGSMKNDTFLKVLAKNYRSERYKVKTLQGRGGLGLHGIVESGLSLAFVCEPGKRTEALVVIPMEASYKAFLEGFRFISYFGDAPPEVSTLDSPPDWSTMFV